MPHWPVKFAKHFQDIFLVAIHHNSGECLLNYVFVEMFDIVRIKFAIDYKLTGLPTATTFHSAKNLVYFLLNKHELDHLILVRFCWHFCNGTCYSTSLPYCSYFDKVAPPPSLNERTLTKQTVYLSHVPFVQYTTDSTAGPVRDNGWSKPYATHSCTACLAHNQCIKNLNWTWIRARHAGKVILSWREMCVYEKDIAVGHFSLWRRLENLSGLCSSIIWPENTTWNGIGTTASHYSYQIARVL